MRLLCWLVLLFLPTACVVYHDGGDSDVEYLLLGDPVETEVAYVVETGDTLRVTTTQRPWSHAFVATEGQPLYMEVRLVAGDGTVTAVIQVDGRLLDVVELTGDGSRGVVSGVAP